MNKGGSGARDGVAGEKVDESTGNTSDRDGTAEDTENARAGTHKQASGYGNSQFQMEVFEHGCKFYPASCCT